MKIKHSILVPTYNQENTIGQTLDSIINQNVSSLEIIVVDDRSTDETWNIIQQYYNKYPKLIKPIRNEENKGVFGNFNYALTLPTGDLINYVAGDDLLPEGILNKYNDFIEREGLDCKDSFYIYSNSEILLPTGEYLFKSNKENFSTNKAKMVENVLLQSLWVWETGMSIGFVKKAAKGGGIIGDIGYQADTIWNVNKPIIADKLYFIDEIGYIYRLGVGVTVNTNIRQHYESRLKVFDIIKEKYSEYLTDRLNKYFKLDISLLRYSISPNLKGYINFMKSYVLYCKDYKFPKYHNFRNNYKILIPIQIKNLLKPIYKSLFN